MDWFPETSSVLQSGEKRVRASLSADRHALLTGQPLPVYAVLLQFLVAGVPELDQDALHVEGVHGVGGHHAAMNLRHTDVTRSVKSI